MQDQELLQEIGKKIIQQIKMEWKSVELKIFVGVDTVDVDGIIVDAEYAEHWFPMNYEISKLFRELTTIYWTDRKDTFRFEYQLSKDGSFKINILD